MTFNYKDKQYEFPNTLAKITLGQRIAFQEMYGDPKVSEDELEQLELRLLEGVQAFAFYTGIPVEEVKGTFDVNQVMNVYTAGMKMMNEEEMNLKPDMGDWTIAPPEVRADAQFTFNEFLTSKEIVRQMEEVGEGKWAALPYLCAVYLRKPGEVFDEKTLAKKAEEMKALPLDIALAVAFFLSSTMSLYQTTLQSSSPVEEKELT